MKYVHYTIINGKIEFVCMAHWGPNLDFGGGDVEYAIVTNESKFNRTVLRGGRTYEGELIGVPLDVARVMGC